MRVQVRITWTEVARNVAVLDLHTAAGVVGELQPRHVARHATVFAAVTKPDLTNL
jgi:hypothetical protein